MINPEFNIVTPGLRSSYRLLQRAILDARGRVPVLYRGSPVTWRAERVDGKVRLSAWLAGGAK